MDKQTDNKRKRKTGISKTGLAQKVEKKLKYIHE